MVATWLRYLMFSICLFWMMSLIILKLLVHHIIIQLLEYRLITSYETSNRMFVECLACVDVWHMWLRSIFFFKLLLVSEHSVQCQCPCLCHRIQVSYCFSSLKFLNSMSLYFFFQCLVLPHCISFFNFIISSYHI